MQSRKKRGEEHRVPVRDEIVVEGHASGGGGVGLRSLEVATGAGESSGRIGSGKSEG